MRFFFKRFIPLVLLLFIGAVALCVYWPQMQGHSIELSKEVKDFYALPDLPPAQNGWYAIDGLFDLHVTPKTREEKLKAAIDNLPGRRGPQIKVKDADAIDDIFATSIASNAKPVFSTRRIARISGLLKDNDALLQRYEKMLSFDAYQSPPCDNIFKRGTDDSALLSLARLSFLKAAVTLNKGERGTAVSDWLAQMESARKIWLSPYLSISKRISFRKIWRAGLQAFFLLMNNAPQELLADKDKVEAVLAPVPPGGWRADGAVRIESACQALGGQFAPLYRGATDSREALFLATTLQPNTLMKVVHDESLLLYRQAFSTNEVREVARRLKLLEKSLDAKIDKSATAVTSADFVNPAAFTAQRRAITTYYAYTRVKWLAVGLQLFPDVVQDEMSRLPYIAFKELAAGDYPGRMDGVQQMAATLPQYGIDKRKYFWTDNVRRFGVEGTYGLCTTFPGTLKPERPETFCMAAGLADRTN